jgi:cyclic beta-1,2-glucan synthetase
VGRGGWSWYTGSAAWLHRAAVESMFGLKLAGEHLHFEPCLPSHWPRAEITLVRDGRTMRFILLRGGVNERREAAAALDAGLLLPGQRLHWAALSMRSTHVIPLAAADA